MTDENLKILTSAWLRLKTEEKEINANRIAIEKEILDILKIKDLTKDFTQTIDDKILTLTPSVTKKVDGDILAQIVKDNDLKEEFKIAFKREYKIDAVKLKTLDKTVQALFNKAVSVKFNKPTFHINKTVE